VGLLESINIVAEGLGWKLDEEYDEVIIEGTPNIHELIIWGVHGDIGRVAVTVNTIPRAV